MTKKVSTIVNSLKINLKPAPWWALFIIVLVAIGNIVSLFATNIHPDEAYYWAWSVYPDFSYVDHPPMVAWMIWLVDKLVGINDVTLRLPAFFAWLVATILVYKISTKHYGDKIYGWLAAAIFSILPVSQAASQIVTPDSPLLLFVVLTYYFLFDAVTENSSRSWLITGAMTGMGLLSKYNAVLLPLIIFLGLVVTPDGRARLRRLSPWLAGIIAGILFLPVVYWNYANHWISFSLQLGHGVGSEFKIENILTYIGGQLGAALLWMMLLMVVASIKRTNVASGYSKIFQYILIAGFWVPLVFFGWASGTKVGQVNWPAMAYLPGTILLAGMLGSYLRAREERASRKPALVVASLLLISCLISVTLVNMFRYPIATKKIGLAILPTNTQVSDTYGWPELKNRIEKISRTYQLGNQCRVYLTTRYMWASISYRYKELNRFAMVPGSLDDQYFNWASRGFFSKRKPCLVVERLPVDKSKYASEKDWKGLGKWRLIDILTTPTSDTPRIYGFYLPDQSKK